MADKHLDLRLGPEIEWNQKSDYLFSISYTNCV